MTARNTASPLSSYPQMVGCYPTERPLMSKGKGSYLYDNVGNRYLDFGSGIAVNALGNSNTAIKRAARQQIRSLIHCSNLYVNAPAHRLAQAMVSYTPFNDKRHSAVFFSNSGIEANEAALKFAACYGQHIGKRTTKFAHLSHSFHGRSFLTLSITDTARYRAMYSAMVPPAVRIQLNNSADIDRHIDPSITAVMVEPIQGEGGLDVVNVDFIAALTAACKKHRVLIIADEIQSGIGRVGTFYASEMVGLSPDIITLSKALGGGFPLGATLITDAINQAISVGAHGSTLGGGPVQCAVAHTVWSTINNPQFLERVRHSGTVLEEGLHQLVNRHAAVVAVKGMGLLVGLQIATAELVPTILEQARNNGLLVLRSGNDVIRIAPPLTITVKEIKHGLAILDRVLAGCMS